MKDTPRLDYAFAAYERYRRHCSIYKVSPLNFCTWLIQS